MGFNQFDQNRIEIASLKLITAFLETKESIMCELLLGKLLPIKAESM